MAKWARWAGVWIGCVVLLVGAGVLATLRQSAYGLTLTVTTSGSMGTAVPTGSLVLSRTLDQYAKGQIITFQAPDASGLVTHRIHTVTKDVRGMEVLTTQGDANDSPDPWTLSRGAVRGSTVLIVPLLGYMFWFIHTPWGFAVTTVTTLVIAVLPELFTLTEYFLTKRYGYASARQTSGVTGS